MSKECLDNLPLCGKYSGSGGGLAGKLQLFKADSPFPVCGNRMQKIYI